MSLLLASTEAARPEIVVQAYHVLLTHHRPDARLFMVGAEPTAALREYVRQLNLRGLVFVDRVPPEAADAHEMVVIDDSPLLTAEAVLEGI